jgi:hypothetical protein
MSGHHSREVRLGALVRSHALDDLAGNADRWPRNSTPAFSGGELRLERQYRDDVAAFWIPTG